MPAEKLVVGSVWKLELTACFPNSYKITAIGCVPNNSFTEFFPTEKTALAEIKRRAGVLVPFWSEGEKYDSTKKSL